MKSSEGWGWLL